MGFAENVARFVLAADNLVNALSTPPAYIALAKNQREKRIERAYVEYNEARAAICGPDEASQVE